MDMNNHTEVDIWKVKKMIKELESARGNGTSMISLIIPPKQQISKTVHKLTDEYGTASNIQSRVNRLSVLGALTSIKERLKLYTKVPTNGLVIYCGLVLSDDKKDKKVLYAFEPFKPINHPMYQYDARIGFIVLDGNGCLFGTLAGQTRQVLHKVSVDLPKKHNCGGQSAARFARLRLEARHNYVRKIAELAVQFFIKNDKCNVTGLVLAGSADFKTVLAQSDLFDQRLSAKVVTIVDVSYGGQQGFNEAIQLAADSLTSVKFVQEKKLIQKYFNEISQDTGRYCFGVEDTFQALELGAVESLIVYENLTINRYTLKNPQTEEEYIKILTKKEEEDPSNFVDPETNVNLETVEQVTLSEWLAENYKQYGCALEFVTNKSQEGSQFVKGFGGIGGLLRYKVDFAQLNYDSDEYYSD